MSLIQQARRHFQGGRLTSHQPFPPSSHGASKNTPGIQSIEGNKKQPSDSGINTNVNGKSSRAAASLKASTRVSSLLSFGSKTYGQPPAIHLPWNKARVRPLEQREGNTGREGNGKGEVMGRGLERDEAAKREIKGVEKEGRERWNERGRGEEIETWGRHSRNSMMNDGMKNNFDRGEANRPEHKGELPGLLSSGHIASLDGGILINGSYFQTAVEPSKPPPMKQKLIEALSLISLTRRLQGPARLGDEQWSNGKSWQRGGENSSKMNDSIGGMSISASVADGAMGEGQRRWDRQFAEENSFLEQWWKREKRFPNSDSEAASGSKESPSEFSASTASSLSSLLEVKRNKTNSDTETENNVSDLDTEKEEETPESDSGSQRESGAESEDEWKELSKKDSKGSARNSMNNIGGGRRGSRSAKVKREKTNYTSSSSKTERSSSKLKHLRHSDSIISSSRPQTSRHSYSVREMIAEESEDEEESEEGEEEEEEEERQDMEDRRARTQKQTKSHIQSDIGSGAIDVTDDLSPITEDTEEEERSSSHAGEKDEDKEDGDLEN
ncbi:RNA polymerase-associated protein LEO1-like [Antennarius striatus]|uniref:RNA polymerase-associated protein LEO1-like n=1 Tax=Antennarius striatus TaxID=241820 RepID=UPI0035B2A851